MSTYTAEQRLRRDRSPWTKVQAILAPLQLAAFLVSVSLVTHALLTDRGYGLANGSIVVKITLLWLITITGMLWEKEIYGRWFMAREFFWEDLGNLVAILTHNLYFIARALHWSERAVLALMLAAYLTYLLNFAQFAIKGYRSGRERRAPKQRQHEVGT
ncbi:MAG: 2-vinyl bacteriochlorophyllide hydratase [Herpetosiphonaceae bacterium]|nr:2-vinyl bacteriochlorophyllide hydratase [Herpetosiphonaceae bacterium]